MNSVFVGGVDIPLIGLGVWQMPKDSCADLVARAVRTGYRHVDTAAIYGNEAEVGEGLRHSGVPREEIFVTTKIWMEEIADGRLQKAAEAGLARLGLDQVDLLLIHWPNPAVPLAESLKALAEVKRRGLTRAIGVSNFTVDLLDQAAAVCPEPLAVNQVEYHPYLSQKPVLDACRRLGMALTAYSPLAQGKVLHDPTIFQIAEAHQVTTSQVVLRWLIQQGDVIAIPKSANLERAATNLDIAGFELTTDEMAKIGGLARPDGRVINPKFAPKWDAAA
jgi:diketogulonate reductase-like aldo/keto reductase